MKLYGVTVLKPGPATIGQPTFPGRGKKLIWHDVAMRVVRISAMLALVLVLGYACLAIVDLYMGDRVYLRNSSACSIALMSQHDGRKAAPSETVLVKSGFVKRTPVMLIAHGNGSIWIGGLHFSADKFSLRGEADREIPADWMHSTWFGRRLLFDLTQEGQLFVVSPVPDGRKQPLGFPIKLRDGTALCSMTGAFQ